MERRNTASTSEHTRVGQCAYRLKRILSLFDVRQLAYFFLMRFESFEGAVRRPHTPVFYAINAGLVLLAVAAAYFASRTDAPAQTLGLTAFTFLAIVVVVVLVVRALLDQSRSRHIVAMDGRVWIDGRPEWSRGEGGEFAAVDSGTHLVVRLTHSSGERIDLKFPKKKSDGLVDALGGRAA